ncbi:hypothetical protein M406DRAFT_260923 [Cryphonectria parasitica EP155]|uniref:Outer spore wall protein RRT8 n=1 Tax=Cryphonectria parasitica (strain ATCC 38755 / EP155) TaxID=660469 RepID=A0A9P4XZ57_CRYP1|nr:uncharacterized protein M406DRAFT_260923 [Cryphonectria parasitica EP155]KAF3763589.1 hypothetical protein M406DRAFT_260923 [Cryphonectria parasitica EP155]
MNSQFLNYIYRAGRAAAYPVQGMWYFARHREFWPLWMGRLLPLSIISLIVYLILFLFAYLPQVGFLAIWQGSGAWVNALILTLGEGQVLIQALFEGFFVDECRVDIFDATLINEGLVDLVAPQRLLFPDAPNSVKMLGKPTSRAEYAPWSFTQLFELVIYLPLNFIPVVGSPAYIIITGSRLGKLSFHRWYKLRGLSRRERKSEAKKYTWDFVWFGTVAMVLELIPLLAFFFLLTTATGCALWVSKLEKKARGWGADDQVRAEEGQVRSDGEGTQTGPQEANGRTGATVDENEPPPPYSDDPI